LKIRVDVTLHLVREKQAYELSTLTGTQVLLLVASETGNVYTFATPKLQPLITKPEGKTLIQACLNPPEVNDSPHQSTTGSLPHQRIPPSETHNVFPEKKSNQTYQSKEGIQNMWAPIQDRLVKDSKNITSSGLSEINNFPGYNTTTTGNGASTSYTQFSYSPSMGYNMNNVPRYQYSAPIGTYNQFGSPTHQTQESQYSTPNSSAYIYSPSVGVPSSATFNSSIEGSINNKNTIV